MTICHQVNYQKTFFIMSIYTLSMSDNEHDFFDQLGLRLATARKAAGFTQQALADHLSMKQTVVASYETGRRRMPVSQLEIFAQTLDVSINYLLGLDEVKSKRGPATKLQKQLQEASKLPRSEQQLISKVLERFIGEPASH